MIKAIAVHCLLLLSLNESRADELSGENRRIIEAFLEHPNTSPDQIREVLRKSINELRPESLKFDGSPTSIPNTRVRVKGANPPCGNNDLSAQQKLGESLFSFGQKVMLGGVLLPDPTGIGSTALLALGGMISSIGKAFSSDPYQEVANCSLSCTAIPGKYGREELNSIAKVTYLYSRGDGSMPRILDPLDNGDWFVAGDWIVDNLTLQVEKTASPEIFGATLIKVGAQEYSPPGTTDTVLECPVTLVCAQGKNWSHVYSRSLSVNVLADIRQVSVGACLDASMVNKSIYHTQLVKAVPQEFLGIYYAEKLEQIRAQTQYSK